MKCADVVLVGGRQGKKVEIVVIVFVVVVLLFTLESMFKPGSADVFTNKTSLVVPFPFELLTGTRIPTKIQQPSLA